MRIIITIAFLAACDPAARTAGPPASLTGIHHDASTGDDMTGDLPRLDLGPEAPIPDPPAEESTGGETTGTSSSGESSSDDTTGEPATTSTSESTGAQDTTTGTTGGESSTGDPPEPVCKDMVCEAAERAPCWGPGWCFADCYQDPACESDCPCTPEAAAVKNFCLADPPVVCSATAPGGYCDPNGDGQTDDADVTRGFYEWLAKCG
jgi:hypothetical protein